MSGLNEFLVDNKYAIGCATLGLVTGIAALKWIRQRNMQTVQSPNRICGVDYPADVVMVHGIPGVKAPNLGHFVMKLETYLRVNKIPYQPVVCTNFAVAPKGKIPYIEYNGVTMGDSQFVMEYLNKELNIDMNSHLNDEERAYAWAIQKWIEEFTYYLNVHSRWIIFADDMYENYQTFRPRHMKSTFREAGKERMKVIGVGRHTDEEIQMMVANDLRHFSNILGKKPYIMGDRISEVDCAAFGILSEIRWQTPDADIGKTLLTNGDLRNVSDYLDRIKEKFWPDWDSLLIKNN